MKFYFAGTEAVVTHFKNDFGIKNYLVSRATLSVRKFKNWSKVIGFEMNKRHKDKNLFLDSGAFSIKQGTSNLTFYDYIDFVERFGKTFNYIASFDVIGDPESTYNNYIDMTNLGFNVIPTYHFRSPIEYFDKYCKMTDYVALGGIVTHPSNPALTMKIVEKIVERKPKDVKLHVFGLGSPKILKRWGRYIESVDNTTWLAFVQKMSGAVSRYGRLSVYYKDDTKQTKDETLMLLQYNIRRFQELENDINEIATSKDNESESIEYPRIQI